MSEILYLKENEVRQTLTMPEAIEIARRGLEADARGQVVGDKFYMHIDEDRFIKPFSGYMHGEDIAYVKTFTYFPAESSAAHAPTTGSQVLLYDSRDGRLLCLMEAGWVTALKTGASSALTAQMLARKDSRTLVVFGAGLLGETHMSAMAASFDLEQAVLIDIDAAKARRLADRLSSELDLSIGAAELNDREEAVREADIVVTVTTGDQALVEKPWLKAGAFVARLGSHQEVAFDVLTEADKLVVDRWAYVSHRVPELAELIARRELKPDDLHAEWLDIVAGKKAGRESSDEIILYIALGIWGEYAALLPEVFRRGLEMNLGNRI